MTAAVGDEESEKRRCLETLCEMFPGMSVEKLHAVSASSKGEVDMAVAMLMSDVEANGVDEEDHTSQIARRIHEAVDALRGQTVKLPTFQGAAGVLLRIFNNILKEPGEHKYRKVPINGKVFASKVGAYSSSRALLEAAGFEYREVDGEGCVIYAGSDMARLYIAVQELEAASNAVPTSSTALQSILANTETIVLSP